MGLEFANIIYLNSLGKTFYKDKMKNKLFLNIGKIVLLLLWTIFIAWFFSTFYFQSPIKRLEFQCFICKRSKIKAVKSSKQVKKTTPTPTSRPRSEEEIVFSKKHGEILWKIYGLESSWGRNDPCRVQGLYNGFGYNNNQCFMSFEGVVDEVDKWFDKRLKKNKNNLAESICFYNLGVPNQVNCLYWQSYVNI